MLIPDSEPPKGGQEYPGYRLRGIDRVWGNWVCQVGGALSTRSTTPPPIVTEAATFSGIDYYNRNSVWYAIEARPSQSR